MLNDSPCSLLVETEILPWLRRPCFCNFDLLEILLHSCELFEDGMFFRLNTIES
jgi:hypothetical protein